MTVSFTRAFTFITIDCAEDGWISMLQAAASWLITVLPLVDFDCRDDEIARRQRAPQVHPDECLSGE